MKSIKDTITKINIEKRIRAIEESDKAKWGKMNAHQMICHCTDQLRLGSGEKEARFVGNKLTTTLIKHLILLGMPAPKGKVETMPEIKQGAGGTPPKNFEKDRQELIDLINSFDRAFADNQKRKHPAFGDMNYKQWSRLGFIHLDYHIRQFGR